MDESDVLSDCKDTQFRLEPDVLRRIGESVSTAVPDADRVWVFGSVARGDNDSDSDVDVDVFFTFAGEHSTKGCVFRNASARKNLRWLNEIVPSHEVDVSSCSSEVFDAGGSSTYVGTLISEVLADGVLAYP